MKRIFLLVLLLTVSGAVASAQRTMGYWYIAPGALTVAGHNATSLHMGGGGEFALLKGISAGVEGGALGLTKNYTNSVMGTASVNGYYHFFHAKDAKFDPFVTGGYSLFVRHGIANLGNYGGGMNYWFSQHMAARVEVRDHITGDNPRPHYWGVRIGMSFTGLLP